MPIVVLRKKPTDDLEATQPSMDERLKTAAENPTGPFTVDTSNVDMTRQEGDVPTAKSMFGDDRGDFNDPEDQRIFNQTGEPVNIPFTDIAIPGLRTQKTVNEQGETSTTFVEPPGVFREGPKEGFFDSRLDPVDKTALGATTEAMKNILSFGEWLLDANAKRLSPAAMADTDPDSMFNENWFAENFPTLPADDPLQKAGMEIGSVIMGGVGGASLAAKLDEMVKLSPVVAKFTPEVIKSMTSFWHRAQQSVDPITKAIRPVDPAIAAKNFELFVRGIIVELGASSGATITTPQNTDSFTGNITGLQDTPEQERASLFIDNLVGSAAVGTALKVIGKGVKKLGSQVFGGLFNDPSNQLAVAERFFKQVDPTAAEGLPAEEYARRLNILAEVLDSNKELRMTIEGAGDQSLDVTIPQNTALAMKDGAKKYFKLAFPIGSDNLPTSVADYEKWIDQQAEIMIQNTINLKKSRSSSPEVIASDAAVNKSMTDTFTQTADMLSPRGQANESMGNLAGETVEQLSGPKANLDQANLQRKAAEGANDLTRENNDLLQALQNAKQSDSLGSTRAEKDALARLSADGLIAEFNKRFQPVKAAYKAVREDAKVDLLGMAEVIDSAGRMKTPAEVTGMKGPANQIPKRPDPQPASTAADGTPIEAYDPVEELRDQMDGTVTLNWLANEWYPKVTSQVDAILRSDPSNKDVEGILTVRDWVKKNILDQSPSYQHAENLFKEFQASFGQTEALKAFADKARRTFDESGTNVMGVQLKEDAAKVIEGAFDSSHPDYLEHTMAVLRSGSPNADVDIAQYQLAIGIKAAAVNFNDKTTATAIFNAMKPQLEIIERVDPTAVADFKASFDELLASEGNLDAATKAAAKMQEQYTELAKDASMKAASKFIKGIDVGSKDPLALTSNMEAAWKSIFSDTEAVGNVQRLMAEAKGRPDEVLIVNGIRGEFLRFMKDKFTTAGPVAISEGGDDVVRDVSGARLKAALGGERDGFTTDTTLAVAKTLFPEGNTAEALKILLTKADENVNMRLTKASTGGSDTANNLQLLVSTNRLVQLTVGVLSRPATIARNIGGALAKGVTDQREIVINRLLDEMVINPGFLAQALKAVGKQKTDDQARADLGMLLGTNILRAVGTSNKGEDMTAEDEQTNFMLQEERNMVNAK